MKFSFRGAFVILAVVLAGAAGAWWYSARYSAEIRVYKVAVLVRGASSAYKTSVESFLKTMRQLGHKEGEGGDIRYDIRYVNTKDEINGALQEFIAENVDVIHVYSTPATQAAYEATRDMLYPIPIVFGSMGDPLSAGVIKNAQRPGTNVTGVASLSTELTAKRLELLKEINPKIQRVAVPHTAVALKDAASLRSLEIARETAEKLGITLVYYSVAAAGEHERIAASIVRKDVDGMIISADSLIFAGLKSYVAQALKEKIPFAVFDISQVEQGGLVGFGPDYAVTGEQSARLVHQVLWGGNPSVIPVEVPKKLLLAVNLNTARAIGVVLSQEFLKKADVVVGK